MPQPFVSDEELLSYLLGGLDSVDQQKIHQALLVDPVLRRRLTAIQELQTPLAGAQISVPSPADLTSKVMDAIQSTKSNPSQGADKEDVRLQLPIQDPDESSAWTDTLTLAVCIIVLVSLVAPWMLRSRELARSQACVHRLAALGELIQSFARYHKPRTAPEIPVEGPLSFAGAYAVQLHDAELLTDLELRWCPSEVGQLAMNIGFDSQPIPSAKDFEAMSATDQRYWRHVAGGSYAYNLGFFADPSKHRMPLVETDAHIAILGDGPTANEDGSLSFTAHNDGSCNVLFLDGRVQTLQLENATVTLDHPYFNRAGKLEAGLDPFDSTLGPSFVSPRGLTE